MGSRWAWVGMVGLCALTPGCREREGNEAPAAAPGSESVRPVVATPSGVPVSPAVAQAPARQSGTAAAQAPARQSGTAAAQAPTQRKAEPPLEEPQVREPERSGTAAGAPASTATAGAAGDAAGAEEQGAPREGRVMIGYEAVQARDDEAWYEGAARAAKDASTRGSPGSLKDVVIASSSVNGRVIRVGRDIITVRDVEGTDYELHLDRRSRGLRQGQQVPLREIIEGTPVRAQFVLMGGRTIARDVQIRR